MRRFYSSAALVVLAACVDTRRDPVDDPTTIGDGTPKPIAPPACPLDVGGFTQTMELSTSMTVLDMAVTANGDAVFAAADGQAPGVTLLSPSGETLFAFPFGSAVATDGVGNTFIAGAFTSSIDLGNGMVIVPTGTADTFVAKIDARGHVVFARALGVAGGVTSLAVGPDLRIAVSGPALGTLLLSPSADVERTLALAGDVAFDAQGHLAIAGNADTANGFVTLVDRTGNPIYRHALPGADHVTSVAVDSTGDVVFAGWTTSTADILGTTIVTHALTEIGRVDGAFVGKVDTAGARVFVRDTAIDASPLGSEASGVAIDSADTIYVNGALTGGTGFGRRVVLTALTPDGAVQKQRMEFVASGYGRGFGVATDACRSVYATYDALDTPASFSPLRAYVVKLSP